MKTGEPFLATLGSLLQAFRLWGLREEMWAEKKTTGGWGRVKAREQGIPSSLPLRLFFFLFFFSFIPSRRTPLCERLEQATIFVGALQLHLYKWNRFFLTGFDPVWPGAHNSWSDQSQLARAEHLLYWSTLRNTGRRLSAWSKRNQGAWMKTSTRELTANFHYIFQIFSFRPNRFQWEEVKIVYHLPKKLRKIR